VSEEPVAAGDRRLSSTGSPGQAVEDLRLLPLPVEVARQLLAGSLRYTSAEGPRRPRWHPEYPLPDSFDAIAMVVAAHRAMTGAFEKPPAWWVHQILLNSVVVGDIGFHGPADPDGAVEIGYTVVPAWRGRGVATRACGLIIEQAWRDGAEIVIAETDDDNVASQAVLLRNGFHRRPDGVFVIKRPEAR
jgi:[ribosomal protein S5]-alanine N-acetyltransferase